jgi:hypothetical protein
VRREREIANFGQGFLNGLEFLRERENDLASGFFGEKNSNFLSENDLASGFLRYCVFEN